MYFLFSFPLITLFYLGATISQLICCFTFDVGSTLFYPLLCIYIIIILIKVFLRYPFSDSYKSPYLPTNFFIRPKVVTLEELQHDITKVRMAPPTFLVKGPNVKTYELEYLTWQEEGADVRLPSNVPIFAYFSIESYPASDVELEFTVNNRRGQTTYKIVANVDVECEPMILMNGNDKTFELLNRKYMRIVYLISLLFSFDFILDLVYWAHVEFVQIKCIKNASTKDELRAKYGEKDMNASANVQYDNELIHMSDADQIFSELNPNPTT
ncbi:hypothetical protein GPJ56_004099 [Histomonas meleagridis]|uniref:uncharacterized protein n=1 Tax=Histomonas meleagridis TaxID=135588 RepID=UPI00355AAB5B|nr:hypothetical protein GPJ56_004099 [Histomonas meleagridis]KAH0801440.1 hypothetical protein GO595_005692 [Histomonas meleagridis]